MGRGRQTSRRPREAFPALQVAGPTPGSRACMLPQAPDWLAPLLPGDDTLCQLLPPYSQRCSSQNSAGKRIGTKLKLVASACHCLRLHFLLVSLPFLPVPVGTSHHCFLPNIVKMETTYGSDDFEQRNGRRKICLTFFFSSKSFTPAAFIPTEKNIWASFKQPLPSFLGCNYNPTSLGARATKLLVHLSRHGWILLLVYFCSCVFTHAGCCLSLVFDTFIHLSIHLYAV